MIAVESYVEAFENVVQVVAFIFGDAAGSLGFGVFVEMRLNGYYIVVVVDANSFEPRVVGAGDVNFFKSGVYAEHYRRNQNVAGARHSAAGSECAVFEPCESVDANEVESSDFDVRFRTEQFLDLFVSCGGDE